MTTTFPKRAEEIDAGWVNAALASAGVLPEGRVSAVEATPVAEQGQMSEVVRLHPTYQDAPEDAPATLIAKFAASFEPARSQMQGVGGYLREVRFYQEVGADPGIDVPRVYAAQIDGEGPDHVLLTEDLSPGRCGDPYVGNLADVEAALDALPAFHARWWQSDRLRGFTWLRQPDDTAYYHMLGQLLEAFVPVVEQKYPDHFTGYTRDAARRLSERWEAFWPHRGEALTMVHSDYHPKQIFFPAAEGGRFSVFDWQSAGVASGAMDVHRIMLFGLSRDDFARHRQRLVERYHAALAERGVEYPLEALEHDYQKTMLLSLFIQVFALATSDVGILERAAEARGVDLYARLFGDVGAAMELCGVIDAIP